MEAPLALHGIDCPLFLWKRLWPCTEVPAGSPSNGRDVAVYVFDINKPSLLTPFHSVLVSMFVFITLSTVFHLVNSPDNPPLSHSVLPVLFLPYGPSTTYLFMKVSFSPDVIHCG